MATCDACFSLRHHRCRGCGCSVCAERQKSVRPAPPPVVERVAAKPKAKRVSKPRAPRARPSTATGAPKGATPWALTTEQRCEVYALFVSGRNIGQIVNDTGFTRSRVKSEVGRIRRGVLPVDLDTLVSV